ncbi:MAG: hypothetical protein AAB403_05780 [Planctomycetota bacterium]
MPLPQNLLALHFEEERIRSLSLTQIASDPGMQGQIESLEASMTVLIHFSSRYPSESRDLLTIQELGCRLNTSISSGLKLVLSGYYLPAVAQRRDLFETGQLLDHFRSDSKLIAEWREAESRRDRDPFQPKNVRKALDDRDGNKERKRDIHYRDLSIYATHPHPKATLLLRRAGGSLTHGGPFHDDKLLFHILHEIGDGALLAAEAFLRHFKMQTREDAATHARFQEVVSSWHARRKHAAISAPAISE